MDLFAIYDLERWVGASAGLFTAKSESDMMKKYDWIVRCSRGANPLQPTNIYKEYHSPQR